MVNHDFLPHETLISSPGIPRLSKLIRGKQTDKFAQTADETYDYLNELIEKYQNNYWSPHGLYPFKYSYMDGFIY